MSVEDRFKGYFEEASATRQAIEKLDAVLRSGGGGPTDFGMEERVAKLETHFEYVRRDLDALKVGQDQIISKIDTLSSSVVAARGHTAGKVTVITTGIAVVAIILGVLAFGGDRFSQGMEVAAAAKAARADAEPWNQAPVVDLPLPDAKR